MSFKKMTASEAKYTTRMKLYPTDGSEILYQILTYDRPHFNPYGYESEYKDVITNSRNYEKVMADGSDKAYKRARQKVFDYMMCNKSLDLFVTLTFNKEEVDRYSYADIVKKINVWLNNRVKRNGLSYVLIPEYHKDGAIHFHGVANKNGLNLVDSGKKRKGKKVWNIEDFPLGFTACLSITGENSNIKIAKYIFKYMVKNGNKKIGGRYYLHGGKLENPHCEYTNMTFDEMTMGEVVEMEGVAFKIWQNKI